MLLQGACKYAGSPLFLINFPLTWNQTGWRLHQTVLKNSSRTSYTNPPATYPKPWRPHPFHHPQSNREHLGSGIAPTGSPFLQTFVR
jgi:hypothetical protein